MINYLLGGVIIISALFISVKQVKNMLKGKCSCDSGCSGCSGNCNIKEK